jgi:hypothetical protein
MNLVEVLRIDPQNERSVNLLEPFSVEINRFAKAELIPNTAFEYLTSTFNGAGMNFNLFWHSISPQLDAIACFGDIFTVRYPQISWFTRTIVAQAGIARGYSREQFKVMMNSRFSLFRTDTNREGYGYLALIKYSQGIN